MKRPVLRVIRGGFLTFRCWSGPVYQGKDVGFRIVVSKKKSRQ
jgi:hypothetical protein